MERKRCTRGSGNAPLSGWNTSCLKPLSLDFSFPSVNVVDWNILLLATKSIAIKSIVLRLRNSFLKWIIMKWTDFLLGKISCLRLMLHKKNLIADKSKLMANNR